MARVLQPFEYQEASTLADAIKLLSKPGTRLFAGGCELVPSMRRGEVRYEKLISIMKIDGLNEFKSNPKTGVKLGSQVLISKLSNDIWIGKRWAALHEAVDQLHPPHIRNMGTVIGNVCAAVNYYDLPTSLFAHRAVLTISNGKTEREVNIADFYTGARKTDLKANEIVICMDMPPPAPDSGSCFKKIYKARRRKSDLHKLNAAAYVALSENKETISDATIALGCIGDYPIRLRDIESELIGKRSSEETFEEAAIAAASTIEPMTDAPWVEEIRKEWVIVLVRDVLAQAASRALSRHDPAEDAQLAY